MTRTYSFHRFIITIFFLSLFFGWELKEAHPIEDSNEEVINPHWTGNHCKECHIEENPEETGASLKFGGDPGKLCTRCHEKWGVRTDCHPVDMVPSESLSDNIPEGWPLWNGTLNCFTCHQPILQMKEDMAQKETNPDFLRGAPYQILSDICFKCHLEENYEKTNPHKQLDENGEILDDRCLFCHQKLPIPELVESIDDVTFNGDLGLNCINCHGPQKDNHPANVNHIRELPEDMKEALELVKNVIELPLNGEKVFCGTCHNAHERGVIKREAAQHGSGKKFFLRLNKGYELCVTCHTDKRIDKETDQEYYQTQGQEVIPQAISKKIRSFHKSVENNRCKACHVVSPKNKEKPKAVLLCFKSGCHDD